MVLKVLDGITGSNSQNSPRILRDGSKAETPTEGTEAGATETATDIEIEEPAAEA